MNQTMRLRYSRAPTAGAAIDKTFKKNPYEGLAESFAVDVKEFYEDNPKRLIIMVSATVGGVVFLVLLVYWVFTRTDLPKMLGLV